MKSTQTLVALILFVLIGTSCSSQTENKKQTSGNDKVEMLYFHFTHRCATCNAVENVSKSAVKELYGDKVSFTSYNLEEPKGKEKGKSAGASGQSLMIISGDKTINITSEGFLYARSNPEKLKEIIKKKIDPLL